MLKLRVGLAANTRNGLCSNLSEVPMLVLLTIVLVVRFPRGQISPDCLAADLFATHTGRS